MRSVPHAMANFIIETAAGVRLSDNLLNHAQIIYGIGPPVARAAQDRARFAIQPDRDLAAEIAHSPLHTDGAAAWMVPRLLVLAADDPTADGVRRALTKPQLPVLGGAVVAHVGRAVLRLRPQELELMWRACEQLYQAHYRSYWAAHEPALSRLAQQAEECLGLTEIPYKLARLTGREPPHADLEVHLLDSETLVSYSGGGERVCISTAILARLERFIYVFAHECARIYLRNPPWWEIEPCASACAGLPGEILDALENCAAHYLAATLALHYGSDPGFWMVHPQVEAAVASRWPGFVPAPDRGIDLLLELVLHQLHQADLHAASVHPLRLAVSYDEDGNPKRCAVTDRRL